MTPDEFAALPADAHHAVWKAAHERRIDWVPNDAVNGTRRYRRAQVLELLRCRECGGEGVVPVDGCTCGDGLSSFGHEPGCGFEPCPAGCWQRLHPAATR
jgi:hypothetical protein